MRGLAIAVASVWILGNSWAQVTERISVASGGGQSIGGGDLASPSGTVVSADGRWVAFMGGANDVVPDDTNATWDVFVRDRQTGTTERVSVDSQGVEGNGFSGLYGIALSGDGRYVAFESRANNLVPGDTNGFRDIFLRDRVRGTTDLVSLATDRKQGNGNCYHLAISIDGRFVAFSSLATNLVPGSTNGFDQVFLRDRASGTTELVSISSYGYEANDASEPDAVSPDGRYVAFGSFASNLVVGDTNACNDIFIRDRYSAVTELVSVQTGLAQANGNSAWASISADSRYVTFTSDASNLVAGDTNANRDVFLRDRLRGTTERVSVATNGAQGDGESDCASISADGRYVAFSSGSTNFAPGTAIHRRRVFVRDRLNGTTELVSLNTDGSLPDGHCLKVSISKGGRYVVFVSSATNLVSGDSNATDDIFLHDRDATSFTSLCGPDAVGVIACPCSNQPSGPGRGCDNSSATGGATLAASGIAYLSMDSLVFTTNGEPLTSTSIVLQGNELHPSGIAFGQGVRCAGGTIKRLYTKTASGGSIMAPDVGAGDLAVSARSAAQGDRLSAGQSRWYLVYYRDPVVLGACSATSTFNATQTGHVSWWF
jgi:Tol biopolymer transport system component